MLALGARLAFRGSCFERNFLILFDLGKDLSMSFMFKLLRLFNQQFLFSCEN